MGPQKRSRARLPHEPMLPHAFLPSQEKNVPKKLTPAQESALATIMGRRVIADAGLPAPGSKPFGDQSTAHAPAKDKYVPEMTARTAVARGVSERTKQHGLLTPAQQRDETDATIAAAKAPTFLSTHDLTRTPLGDLTPPPLPHLTPQQIIDMVGRGPRGLPGAYIPNTPGRPPPPVAPVAPVPRETPLTSLRPGNVHPSQGESWMGQALGFAGSGFRAGYGAVHDINSHLGALGGPAIGKPGAAWVGRNVLAPAAHFADEGLATAEHGAATALAEGFNPGALRIKGGQGGLSAADNPASKISPISGAALASKVLRGGMKVPDININTQDITGLLGGTPAGAATGSASIPFDQLAGQTGWGLTDEARRHGVVLILKNGWTQAQLEAMGGDPTMFILMQYNKPGGLLEQVARAALADVVEGGSQTVGALGLLSEVAQGHGEKALGQFGDQIHQTLPVFGKHPYSQELVAHPVFSATAGLAAIKAGGALGRLRPGPGRERTVTLAGHVDSVTGKPMVVPMGHYDKNLYMQFGQGLRDLAVSHNTRAAAYSWKKIGDLFVSQQRARVTPEHIPVQVPYRNAERSLPPERRAILMAIQDHGGEPGIRDAVAHFKGMEAAGLEFPQERLHLDETLLTVLHNLTPADREWLAAHARLAEHTSTEKQLRGEHSAISQLYRKYETPIELGASRERLEAQAAAPEGLSPEEIAAIPGQGPFTRAKAARDEFLHINDYGGPSEGWLARDREIGRDIKGHAKRAATKAAKAVKVFQEEIVAYREAYKPWKAKQDEIKAREPEKPEAPLRTKAVSKNTRTKNVPTRNEAIALVAPVRAKHPDWDIRITKKSDDTWDVTVTRPEKPAEPLTGQAKRAATIAAKKKAKIAEEHKAWKQELKDHNATKPPRPERPVGLERGAGRLAVHEGEVTRQGKRQTRLRAAQEARQPPPEDQIMQEYQDAVLGAVEAHMARPGAIEPARVPRAQPPVNKKGKFRRGRNLTSNLTIPKSHATTGAHVRSGDYTYDTSLPLRENFNEQLTRMKTGLYGSVVGHPLVHDVFGGGPKQAKRLEEDGASPAEVEAARERTVVPEGVVAVPIHYPGSKAQVTEPLWARETPLDAAQHYDPNAPKSRFRRDYARNREGHLPPGEVIPDGQRVLLVPEGLHNRLDEYAHPNDPDPGFYDRFNRGYQKLLIGIYPSTWMGNAPGSFPLALGAGAYHPRDWWRAFKTGPQGSVSRDLGIKRTDESNAAIQNLGAAARLSDQIPGKDTRNPIMSMAEQGRQFSIYGENFSGRAAWEGRARVAVDGRIPTLRKIFPQLDKIMPASAKGEAARMSVDAATLHRWLKQNKITLEEGKALPGEIQSMVDEGTTKPGMSARRPDQIDLPPHLQEVHDRLVADVMDFMSSGHKPHGRFGRSVGKVVLFQNWIGHIIKLTLFTLPLRHPRRALLMNALSMYGNEYRRENGVYPSWMGQFFPIHGGEYTLSAGLGQLTPTASAQNLAQAGGNALDTANPTHSWLRQINQVVSPLIQPFGAAALAQNDNSKLHPNEVASKFVSPLHTFTAGAYFAIPGTHKFQVLSGYEPGSAGIMGIPLPGPVFGGLHKKDYFVYLDNGDGTTTKIPIRWNDRPGGHPVEGVLGAASRYVGLPLERSAVRGPSWQAQLTNDSTFPAVDWYKSLFATPGLS